MLRPKAGRPHGTAPPQPDKARYALAYNGSDAERVTYEFPGGGYQISAGGCYGDVRRLLFGDLRIYIKLDWLSSNEIYQENAEPHIGI